MLDVAEHATSVLDHYPRALLALVHELTALAPDGEARTTCATCCLTAAHTGADPSRPWLFLPKTRCCTFHPKQPNFLVGQRWSAAGSPSS